MGQIVRALTTPANHRSDRGLGGNRRPVTRLAPSRRNDESFLALVPSQSRRANSRSGLKWASTGRGASGARDVRSACQRPAPQWASVAGVDEASCLNRYEASTRWKPSPFPVSFYLVERLRRYEANHRWCVPGTARYRDAVERLHSGNRNAGDGDAECKYIVWVPIPGIASTCSRTASAAPSPRAATRAAMSQTK
uniref:Fucosyltransferase n=1 Tax=Oryza sativa subsp. japonica TaxID=39947 RepID=Q6Z7V9_ORYSJ|nr:hypothetical protein [Oryza sativa Japonica Group]